MPECRFCGASGSPQWVTTPGSHHGEGCPRHTDVAIYTCRGCDLVGPAEWVKQPGSHHMSTCERYTKENFGQCKHCGVVGKAELVTAKGSIHCRSCPRYELAANEGCCWNPFAWLCTAPDVVGPSSEALPPAGDKYSLFNGDGDDEVAAIAKQEAEALKPGEGTNADTDGGRGRGGGGLPGMAAPTKEATDVPEVAVGAGTGPVEGSVPEEENPTLVFTGEPGDEAKDEEQAAKIGEKEPEAATGVKKDGSSAALVPAPSPAPTPAGGGQIMQIQIPAGVSGGQVIQVQAPGGKTVQVQVPAGVKAGQTIQIQVPA